VDFVSIGILLIYSHGILHVNEKFDNEFSFRRQYKQSAGTKIGTIGTNHLRIACATHAF
jgi:hypothetical protein